jgi:hypothetical protein
MRFADHGVLADAHLAADLGRRVAFGPKGPELPDCFIGPMKITR